MIKYLNIISKYFIITYISLLIYFFLTTGNTLGQEKYLNYTAGYIRRGIIGEIIFLIIKNFQLSIEILNQYLSLTIKIIVLLIIIIFIYIKKINFFLIFSPPLLLAGFQFSAGEQYIFGNLDFLLMLIFLIQIITYNYNKNFIFYCSLSLLGILIHEVFFFITIIPSIFILEDKNKIIPYFILFFFLFIIQGIYKGDIPQIDLIEKQWNKIGIYNKDIGILKSFVSKGCINYWWNANKTPPQKFGFILNNLYILFFITLLAFNPKKNKTSIKNISILVFLQNIVFLVLSIIANDFGRWYFLLFTSIIMFFYIKDEKINLINNLNLNSFFYTKYTQLLEKLYPYRYIFYLVMGLPFGNWSFNFFFHSLVIMNFFKTIKLFL